MTTAFAPTPEQRDVIHAEFESQCIVACPGSGKTATAVRRLFEMRKRLGELRSHVLLLSYSNVAVDTFRTEYQQLSRDLPGLSPRVRIETVDAFLTSYIIRPHASRTMRTPRQPFLVNGSENFLANFKVWDGKYSRDIQYLTTGFDGNDFEYFIREKSISVRIDRNEALNKIEKLGRTGAYTHDTGRFWAVRTLIREPGLLRALAKKFPHVIVDEAQDIGSLHGLILGLLANEGVSISLVGDPNQAIYEFAGADGEYLRDYVKQDGVIAYPLTQNRRSVESIVAVANQIAGASSSHIRTSPGRRHGCYYVKYNLSNISECIPLFESILSVSGFVDSEAAMLCRSRQSVASLTGASGGAGSGVAAFFVDAAVQRDRGGDIAKAFERAVSGLVKLLINPPNQLRAAILENDDAVEVRQIRWLVWRFLKESMTGLPPSKLKASSEWLPKLKRNVDALLGAIEAVSSLKRIATWTNNLTKKDLTDDPLWTSELLSIRRTRFRIDTVHKAKGESIGAVMYVAKADEINALTKGTGTELGRIGYVAITRAADLMILAVPETAKAEVVLGIEGLGFKLWNS